MAKSDSEWGRRTLCSDGNCIGIIGADGRCKVCGLAYDGQLPEAVADADMTDEGPIEEVADVDDIDVTDTEVDAQITGDSWENRTLCIDESCIGVVGPDGRCKACGKPYDG